MNLYEISSNRGHTKRVAEPVDIKSSTCKSSVATLNREVDILGREMIKINATVNDNSK
jgi:hypothetical protein